MIERHMTAQKAGMSSSSEADIICLFSSLDKAFFGGVLLNANTELVYSGRQIAWTAVRVRWVSHDRNSANPGHAEIRLCSRVFATKSVEEIKTSLLHEMIHAYLVLTDGEWRCDHAKRHTHRFQQEVKRLSRLGITVPNHHRWRSQFRHLLSCWQCHVSVFPPHVACFLSYLDYCRQRCKRTVTIPANIGRGPSAADGLGWWCTHAQVCGGQFVRSRNCMRTTTLTSRDTVAGEIGDNTMDTDVSSSSDEEEDTEQEIGSLRARSPCPPREWPCHACTFLNRAASSVCSICGALKTEKQERAECEWACAVCTLLNRPMALQCDACGTVRAPQEDLSHSEGKPAGPSSSPGRSSPSPLQRRTRSLPSGSNAAHRIDNRPLLKAKPHLSPSTITRSSSSSSSASFSTPSAPCSSSWVCPTCTYLNTTSLPVCVKCTTRKTGHASEQASLTHADKAKETQQEPPRQRETGAEKEKLRDRASHGIVVGTDSQSSERRPTSCEQRTPKRPRPCPQSATLGKPVPVCGGGAGQQQGKAHVPGRSGQAGDAAQTATARGSHRAAKQERTMWAVALRDFAGSPECGPDCALCFTRGDELTVLSRQGRWWTAEMGGRRGLVPPSHLQLLG